MFNGSNTAATVNWIDSADFIRNRTGRSTLAEDWNDIILADSAGTVLVEPGIVGSFSPFWVLGLLKWELSDELNHH